MKLCKDGYSIPIELQGEDVYNTLCIFKNEQEAIGYIHLCCPNKSLSDIKKELCEDCQEGELKSFQLTIDKYIDELRNGQYILWQAY